MCASIGANDLMLTLYPPCGTPEKRPIQIISVLPADSFAN